MNVTIHNIYKKYDFHFLMLLNITVQVEYIVWSLYGGKLPIGIKLNCYS